MSHTLKLLGVGAEDQFITTESGDDDDYDNMNDETFGGGVDEDWEFEQIAEQTQQVFGEPDNDIKRGSAGTTVASGSNFSGFSFGCGNRRIDPERNVQEMLEESISQLVCEDDDVAGLPIPNKHASNHNESANLSGYQEVAVSPQSPFVQSFDSFWRDPVWSSGVFAQSPFAGLNDSTASPLHPLAGLAASTSHSQALPDALASDIFNMMAQSTPRQPVNNLRLSPSQQSNSPSLNRLLEHMNVNNVSNVTNHFQPQTRGLAEPVSIKGAKTVEEIEAELRARSAGGSAAMLRQNLPKPMPQVLSCEELENSLTGNHQQPIAISHQEPSHQPLQTSALPAAPSASPFVGFPSGLPVPPGFPAGGPMGMSPLGMPPMPPIPAHLMANPQFRMALFNEMAKRHGMLPGSNPPMLPVLPGGLRFPPGSPFMPPAGPGMMRMPFPPDLLARGLNPQQIMFEMQRRSMANAAGNNRNAQNARQRFQRDPYAGLMSRREREWLIKIQLMQITPQNPDVEDFYFTMFRAKRADERQKNAKNVERLRRLSSMDKDASENAPYVYVPPTFQGSLGKVQHLTANCPRQLIDVSSSNAANSSNTPPVPSSATNGLLLDGISSNGSNSPIAVGGGGNKSPPFLCSKNSDLTVVRSVLMEIESLYITLLDAEDLVRQVEVLPDKAKEKDDKLAHLFAQINSEHFAALLSVKKGRLLILRTLVILNWGQAAELFATLIKHLCIFLKKDINNELHDKFYEPLRAILYKLNPGQISKLIENLPVESIDLSMKSKFAFGIWVLLLQRASNAIAKEGTGYPWFEKFRAWAVRISQNETVARFSDILSTVERFKLGEHLQKLGVDSPELEKLWGFTMPAKASSNDPVGVSYANANCNNASNNSNTSGTDVMLKLLANAHKQS